MRRVVLETPYAGDIITNVTYARDCVRDCILRGETPYASHLLLTQDGVLNDNIEVERKLGIVAGFAWREAAEATVVYTDLGLSEGMQYGIQDALNKELEIEYRNHPKWQGFLEIRKYVGLVQQNLTGDLLKKGAKKSDRPYSGHCYVAAEALYHLLKNNLKLKPCSVRHEGIVHWFLVTDENTIIDATMKQFETPPTYKEGRPRGFLTKNPSKRARILLERVKEAENG